MSLTLKQQNDTRQELKDNFIKSGLSYEKIAMDLKTSEKYVLELMELKAKRHDHTWILRNYLYEKVKAAGKTPTEFTALKGSCRNYWFLDADYIEKGIIGAE